MTVDQGHEHRDGLKDCLLSRTGIATLVVVAILGFVIYTDHTAHVLGTIPYLLLLACPLVHVFMHGRRHHRTRHGRGKGRG
jgi:hypothetical protein